MRHAFAAVVLALLGAAPVGAAPDAVTLNVNLAANPGFEQGAELVFRPLIRYPNYRETIYPGAPRRLDVGVEVAGNRKHPTKSLTVGVTIVEAHGKVIAGARKPAGGAIGSIAVSKGRFADEIGPCGVRVYRLVK